MSNYKEESMFVKIERDIKRINELNDAILKMTKKQLDEQFENYIRDIKASESYTTNNYDTNMCLFTNNKNSNNVIYTGNYSSNGSMSRNSNSVNGIIYGPTIF
jgi:hypothetical protein